MHHNESQKFNGDTLANALERTPEPCPSLFGGFMQVVAGSLTQESFMARAGSRELGFAAKAEGCAWLARFASPPYSDVDKKWLLFASAVGAHATTLCTLGRPWESALLFESILPLVRENLTEEAQVGYCVNYATSLCHLGRWAEAIAELEAVIAILQELVEANGRADLATDLAGARVNKANALQAVGRLADAIKAYDAAIAFFEKLVETSDAVELANDLAGARMNKGAALRSMGRLTEALAEFDAAITIRQKLIEVGGRVELAND